MTPAFEPDFLLKIFLVFVRIGAVLMVAPFFSHKAIPIRVKIFFALLLAYSLSGIITGTLPAYATTTFGMATCVAVEALTGIAIGFAGQLIFWSVQFAGEIIGFQIGLSIAQAFDPNVEGMSNPIGRFLSFAFLLVFLLLEGHHQILRALVASFEVVPLAAANVAATGPFLMTWTGGFLATALRLAAPFMVTIALVDTAMAVFAKVAPQADLMALGIPMKLLIGLLLTGLYFQQFVPVIPGMIDGMTTDLLRLLEVLAVR